MRGFGLLLSALFFVLPPANANGDECRPGPLVVSNQYPLSALHLSFTPRAATVCATGTAKLSLSGAWSNTSIVEDQYIVDAESGNLTPAFSYVAAEDVELALELPLLWRGGGVLDSTIDGWHRIFGLPRGDRRKLENDSVEIRGSTKDGDVFAFNDSGYELGNLKAGIKYALTPQLSYLGELSLPTSSGTFGHSSVDLLNGVLYSKQLAQILWHTGVAHIFFGDDEIAGVTFERQHLEAFGGGEYLLGPRYSVLANISLQSRLLRNVASHPSYALYLELGFRAALGGASWLDLGIRENPLPGDGTTDVSFLVGLSQLF